MQGLTELMASPALLGGIEKLARRGAFAVPPADATAAVELKCERHGEVHGVGEMPRLLFDAAIEQGLVCREGETWRLSSMARSAVRQIRSERVRIRASQPAPHDDPEPPERTAPAFNAGESPLTRLSRRLDRHGQPLLTAEQLAAGERLRRDLWLARLTPRVTQSWTGIALSRRERRGAPGSGVSPSDSVMAAQQRVRRALVASGPEYLDLLWDVCGHLKGLEEIERTANLPQRSARRFLQLALTALARHYGLLPAVDIERRVSHRLRHWGADDYRPDLEPRGPGA